jgi:hypothetical protein
METYLCFMLKGTNEKGILQVFSTTPQARNFDATFKYIEILNE